MPGCCRGVPSPFVRGASVTVIAVDAVTGALLWKRPWVSEPPSAERQLITGACLSGDGLRCITQYSGPSGSGGPAAWRPAFTQEHESKQIGLDGLWVGAQPRGDTAQVDWSPAGLVFPNLPNDANKIWSTSGARYFTYDSGTPDKIGQWPSGISRYDPDADAVSWHVSWRPLNPDTTQYVAGNAVGNYVAARRLDQSAVSAWNAGSLAWSVAPDAGAYESAVFGSARIHGSEVICTVLQFNGPAPGTAGDRAARIEIRDLSDGSLSASLEDPYFVDDLFHGLRTYLLLSSHEGVAYGVGVPFDGLSPGPLEICTGAAEVIYTDHDHLLDWPPHHHGALTPEYFRADGWVFGETNAFARFASGSGMFMRLAGTGIVDFVDSPEAAYMLVDFSDGPAVLYKLDRSDGSTIWRRRGLHVAGYNLDLVPVGHGGWRMWKAGDVILLVGSHNHDQVDEGILDTADLPLVWPI